MIPISHKKLCLVIGVTLLLVIVFPLLVDSQSGKVLVSIKVSPGYVGSSLALFVPLSFTDPPPYGSVYVLKSSYPSYFHVFSVFPPFLIIFEPSVSSENVYEVYSSPQNPFLDYEVSYNSPVFAGYDDFDYDSGFWVGSGFSIGGGKAVLMNGSLSLNTSVASDVSALFNVIGKRSYKLVLNRTGVVITTVTIESGFVDWNAIIDGYDIYFIDEGYQPIYYGIIHFSKTDKILTVLLETNTSTVYMFYGEPNKYPSYRLFINVD